MSNFASRSYESALKAMRTAAVNLSDELHNAEQNGVELPAYVDNAWLMLSIEIERTAAILDATGRTE